MRVMLVYLESNLKYDLISRVSNPFNPVSISAESQQKTKGLARNHVCHIHHIEAAVNLGIHRLLLRLCPIAHVCMTGG